MYQLIKGKYAEAKVFTSIIEDTARAQIKELCDQEFAKDGNIRIMPDVHAGIGCTIGTTFNITDKVCPNLVGVDIGCGMFVVPLGNISLDLIKLDKVVRDFVPSGINIHNNEQKLFPFFELRCFNHLKSISRLERSLGTLGSGNHFIEVDINEKNEKFLVIHSGSRNLGHQVATYYQELAIKVNDKSEQRGKEKKDAIAQCIREGRQKEIANVLTAIENKYANINGQIPDSLKCLTGLEKEDYLYDMDMCQTFAKINREEIASIILSNIGIKAIEGDFHTIHNYIDFRNHILRKGAISAQKGELVLIPINRKDGCILGLGKGNEDWNFSAPHGAGRLMSRGEARKSLSLEQYENDMEGIYSTSVSRDTIDECPRAYKPIESILDNIGDAIEVVEILKPIYSFKASENN